MGCAKAMRENVHFLMTALQKLPQYSAEMTLSTFMLITFELNLHPIPHIRHTRALIHVKEIAMFESAFID